VWKYGRFPATPGGFRKYPRLSLLGLDRARLRDEIDWPGQPLDLFINIVHRGGGTLSLTKRRSQFDWMKDEEIERFVSVVNEAFEVNAELNRTSPGES
jgi:hypothetical protein